MSERLPSRNLPAPGDGASDDANAGLSWIADFQKQRAESRRNIEGPTADSQSSQNPNVVPEKISITGGEKAVPVNGVGWKDPEPQDAEFSPKPPAPEVEAKPKPVKWEAVVIAEPKTPEGKAKVADRKKWLGQAFSMDKNESGAPVWKAGVVEIIRESLRQTSTEGKVRSLLDNRKAMPPEYWLKANALLDTFANQNLSFRDLFNQAKGTDGLRTLKIFSVALLNPYFTEAGPKAWKELNASQKNMVRLGEIIGLEVERRQLELGMGENRLKLDAGQAQRTYERYARYAQNPDIPDMFKKNFMATADQIADRYPGVKRFSEPIPDVAPVERQHAQPEQQPNPVSGTEQSNAGVGAQAPEAQTARPLTGSRSEGFNDAMQELLGASDLVALHKASPDRIRDLIYDLERSKELMFQADDHNGQDSVRAEFKEIYEGGPDGMIEYNADAIARLKTVRNLGDERNEEYRRRFIDSMPLQMTHAAFLNSNPSRWSRLIRGGIDGLRTRWQVVGWRALVPWMARDVSEKMRFIRQEVAESWGALAQSDSYPARYSAAAHAIELSMVNARDVLRNGPARIQENVFINSPAPAVVPRPAPDTSAADAAIKAHYDGQVAAERKPDTPAADEAIASYYNQQAASEGQPAPARTRAEELQRQLDEQGARNKQANAEERARRRAENDRILEARRQEIQRDAEFVGVNTAVNTWLSNGNNRDLARWKIANVDRVAAWQRLAEFLNQPEEQVWQGMLDQFDEQQQRRSAA